MEITYKMENSGQILDIVAEAKTLCKEKGIRIKDLGTIQITQMTWGISLAIYTKSGDYITNCAC